jgi:thioredoxin reductase (NADPH)
MPTMSGTQFLEQAIKFYPDSRKVLLTAYADTEAAIASINTIGLDHYLMKPWHPPEQNLFPVLDDLLSDWLATVPLPYDGIRVAGTQWSASCHHAKDFLARNQIPYQWLDIEKDTQAKELVETVNQGQHRLPVVFFPDGSVLFDPAPKSLAEKIGLQTQASQPFYDLIIIGAGPAGLAAAVYGASEGLRTVVIEKEAAGGQAGTSARIENYLGFPKGLSGADLARRATAQARRLGAEILTAQEAKSVRVEDPYRFVTLSDGHELSCHALLIASGVSIRELDVPNIKTISGAGVYYGAAITEAVNCQGRDVFVVGGANSAGQGAMFLSRYASKVTMGKDRLEAITITNSASGESETLPAVAMFIFAGAVPHADMVAGIVERNEAGFILTGPDLIHNGHRPKNWKLSRDPFLLETSVPGIFAAGDVREGAVRRVASAVGQGSVAVSFVHQYLKTV